MSTSKIVIGALAGLTAGAIVAVLFAPDSGANTRKKIKAKGQDTVDSVKGKYQDIVDGIASKIESVKTEGMKFFDQQKNIAQNTKVMSETSN